MKSKLKLLETKAKEIKSQSQETTKKTDDKSKIKIQTLEKNNEFLKLKLIDLEKKIVQEKENSQLLSNRMIKISHKNTTQEKIIKELQKATHKTPQMDPSTELNQTIQSLAAKNSENFEEEEKDLNETQEKNIESIVKKKPLIKKNSDDAIIFLNLLADMSKCLKNTLPVLFQDENEVNLDDNQKENFDIGSVFYPNFNKIVSHLIELSPILNKKYEIKALHNYVDLLFRMINFAFKFKSTNNLEFCSGDLKSGISSKKLESSKLKIKSLQDHVNEIMVCSSNFKKKKKFFFYLERFF